MDTDQWPQVGCTTTIVAVNEVDNLSKPAEKKPRPEKEQALNCPRCNSANTKFCYYNNYSSFQPRYFCKTCRRYWTQGGSLRTVPVGGGSRKNNKRSISNHNNSNNSCKKILPDLTQPQNPKIHQPHDLNLAYNPTNFNGSSEFFSFDSKSQNPNYDPSTNSSFMKLFKTGNLANGSRGLGLSSFMSAPVSESNMFSSGFAMSGQFKPSLSFSLDGLENGFENLGQDLNINPSRSSLFPFEEVKMEGSNGIVSTNEFAEHHEQDNRGTVQGGEANGFWSGMLAGGSSW